MTTLIINIKELIQIRETAVAKVSGAEMAILPTIKNAYLLIKDNLIADFGAMENVSSVQVDKTIDATGKMVLPSWCDSHTHIVYAGNREQEFVDRIHGMTYKEIANRGGGILNSAKELNEATEQEIYDQSKVRLEEVMHLGTGAVEIKSGYGLTIEGELKMLRVIKRLAQNYPMSIKATFLGAHTFPLEYAANHQGYIDLIIYEMLPEIAKNKLAEFIDVFCETGYFTVDETQQILEAGIKLGLKPKIHVNQFNSIGGVQIGIKYNALSLDHLEVMTTEDIEALKNTDTIPVLLPACSFFLNIPYSPAREIIAAGLPLALATDYNPGSTPSGNMNFVVSAACIKLKMTPEEAINAATLNGAYAMGISKTHGSITIGKKANLILTKPISSYYQLPYAFGSNLIETVFIEGKIFA